MEGALTAAADLCKDQPVDALHSDGFWYRLPRHHRVGPPEAQVPSCVTRHGQPQVARAPTAPRADGKRAARCPAHRDGCQCQMEKTTPCGGATAAPIAVAARGGRAAVRRVESRRVEAVGHACCGPTSGSTISCKPVEPAQSAADQGM